MKRPLCVIGLCLGFMGTTLAVEPPRKAEAPAKPGTPPRLISGRTQLEALLLTPAKLDFEGRKQVTVREVLDQLHQQHHLSLRFDTPTLSALLDKSSQTPSGPYGHPIQGYYPPPATASYLAPLSGRSYGPGGGYLSGIVRTYSGHSMVPVAGGAYYSPDETASPVTGTPSAAPPLTPTAPPAAVAPVGTVAPTSPDTFSKPPVADAPQQAPMPVTPIEPGESTVSSPDANSAEPKSIQQTLEELLDKELDIQTLDLSRVSIATVLRQALDAASISQSEDSKGMPILMTNAALLDYLVEDDGLLITTRMKALSTRETRVYSIKHLQDLPAEQLSKTIRQSIRPWSWRSQINDLGDQLKGTPLPGETLTSLVKTGVQLVGGEVGVDISPESAAESKPTNRIDEARQMEMLGGAITNGLVTLAQSTLLALEMVHYAEPPTATIQTLGHKLIITQSQTAHREIAELLKQLADE